MGRRRVRPEAEDRGRQAAEIRRRERPTARIPAGDEGVAPNADAEPVSETPSKADAER
jgi:hypothetical protein